MGAVVTRRNLIESIEEVNLPLLEEQQGDEFEHKGAFQWTEKTSTGEKVECRGEV